MKEATVAIERAAMHKTLPPGVFVGFLALSSDAVIATDDHQRIVFFNAGAERIFGWRADEVDGQSLMVLLPERFRGAHAGHVARFGESHGQARTMGERSEIRGLRKSGEEFPAEASIQQISTEGRSIFAATLRDVSERKRAEDVSLSRNPLSATRQIG